MDADVRARKQGGVNGAEHSDSGDDDEEEEEQADLLVGYLADDAPPDDGLWLTRYFFPSKVYASRGDAKPSAFHRMVYIFVCTSCQPNRVRAFRAQLPRHNDFYAPDPLEEGDEKVEAIRSRRVDADIESVCCPKCYLPHCRNHEVAGQKQQEVEAEACGECQRRARNRDPPALFPEWEISVDAADVPEGGVEAEEADDNDAMRTSIQDAPDSSEDSKEEEGSNANAVEQQQSDGAVPPPAIPETGDADIDARVQEYRDRIAQDPSALLDKSEAKVFEDFCRERTVKDAAFAWFQKFSAANNSHMLRYEFGGAPLWFCEPKQLKEEPPACPACGGRRVFEFQVQPSLIAMLAKTLLGQRLDYGVIVVYSCEQSCDPNSGASSRYMEEFAYVQPEPVDEWTLPPV